MIVYRVDYLVKRAEGEALPKLPTYVVAEDFDAALKEARKFETKGKIDVYECRPQLADGFVAIARGFKGLKASTEEASTETSKG
jgi:hypothetical protein